MVLRTWSTREGHATRKTNPPRLALLTALFGVVIAAAACSSAYSPSASPAASASESPWQQIAPLGSGGFPPETGSNDSPKWTPGKFPVTLQPILAFNDELWMTSQTNAWSSGDGLVWNHYQKTDTGERIWQGLVFFNDRLWSFGGLRYGDRVPVNEVWSSGDGPTWAQAGAADWSPRKEQAVIVFHQKLWLFGGADKVKADFTTEHVLNDIWSSDDGLHWTQVTAAAPWSPREGVHVLVLNDALYLIGGHNQADVWRSADGANWAPVTAVAAWAPREGYGAIAFDGKLWVYGGWRGKTTNALNDVWYSTDGQHWTKQTEHAPWGPRSPLSVVFKHKLWIYSGKHTGGKDNWGGDIWAMSEQRQR